MVHLRGRELSVLREIMDNPIASEAERDALAARRVYEKPASLPARILIVLACAVAGATTVWSAKALVPVIDARSAANGHIVTQIEDAQEQQETLIKARDAAAAQLETERNRVLESVGFTPPHPGIRIEAATIPAQGPGLSVTFSLPTQADAKLRDRELAMVANNLFAAGAEAIAINGHRLGGTTAVRAAGGAILVNLQPLLPPYRVEAIGETTALQDGVVAGESGNLLLELRGRGIQVDVVREEELKLPAAPAPKLDDSKLGKD
ncbi:MAG: DUF881 domain-containing protein [Buchananella hordeovulneris]|nr:DUF881 domain-containing protein [Buchananella hordeovulneris]